MKIIQLTAENIKRLQAVQITPKGNVVTISGKNGQGKTSCLDAITYALGGDTADKMPVRRGEEKAKVVVDLGDIIVKRTFTAAGGTALVVTNADGVKQTTPQAILDKLVGKLTFDPLAFSREKPKQQAEILRALIGLDFTKQDAERENLFADRTNVNREAKALETRVAALPKIEGLPAEEQSAASVLEEQKQAAEVNALNQTKRRALLIHRQNIQGQIDGIKALEGLCEADRVRMQQLQKQIDDNTAKIITAQEKLKSLQAELPAIEEGANKAVDIDLAPFSAKARDVEQINQKVRVAKQRADLVDQFKAKSAEGERLTEKLAEIDSAKRKATTGAKYPVEGLLFDTAGGVTLNGIPFDQCSAAEQLKVSVAIGLALNPTLRVLLIRDASLLDEDSLKVLETMGAESDVQLWIEVVSSNDPTALVIEDGLIQSRDEEKRLL